MKGRGDPNVFVDKMLIYGESFLELISLLRLQEKKGQVGEKTYFCVLMKDTRFKSFNSMLWGVH